MMSHAMKIPDMPMWVGYNSKLYQDNTAQQRLAYLTPINVFPTKTEVIVHVLDDWKISRREWSDQYNG